MLLCGFIKFRCVRSRNTIQNIYPSHLNRTNLAEGQQCQNIKLGKNSFSIARGI